MRATEWYKSLPIMNKIGLKEATVLLVGMEWKDFNILFTPRERIEIIHQKLLIEKYIT